MPRGRAPTLLNLVSCGSNAGGTRTAAFSEEPPVRESVQPYERAG